MPVTGLEGHSAALSVAFASFPCLPHGSVVASTGHHSFPLSPIVGWAMSCFPERK